jgi:hypothetical protein
MGILWGKEFTKRKMGRSGQRGLSKVKGILQVNEVATWQKEYSRGYSQAKGLLQENEVPFS